VRRLAIFFAAASMWAQTPQSPNPLLNNSGLFELYGRAIQLMESTGFAVPDLARAGAPLVENAKQGLANVRSSPANAEFNRAFLSNLRAYVQLADAVPKPFPFSETAQKQFGEIRDVLTRAESHFQALVILKDRQLRNPDPDNLARYAEADSRIGPVIPGKPRVVFLGDSITDSWRLNEYFPDHDFINRGISGQITGQMLGRMQSDVINLRPDAMLVLGGTNDIARGISLAAIENNLTLIADLAEYHKIKLILASVLPVSDYHKDVNPNYEMTRTRPPASIRALNVWIQSLCARRNFKYLDYYSHMVDAAGFMQSDLAEDGLHPNSKGYRIMAPEALKAVDSLVKTIPQEPPRKRRFFGK
jgi:lysophospholipase L1-like esterase